jgi:hypothetical protein
MKSAAAGAVAAEAPLACRLCGRGTRVFASREDLSLFRCRDCGFVSASPAHLAPAAEHYNHYYDAEMPAAPDRRYEEWLAEAEAAAARSHASQYGAVGASMRPRCRPPGCDCCAKPGRPYTPGTCLLYGFLPRRSTSSSRWRSSSTWRIPAHISRSSVVLPDPRDFCC